MKRLALFAFLMLGLAAGAAPRKEITIDYNKPSEKYKIDSKAGDVFPLRVFLKNNGERYIPTVDDGFLIGFGTNGTFSTSLVITNGTPSLLSNFVDFVVSGLTLDTSYFSQILLTNTVDGSVSIFGEGKAEVTRNPLGGSTLDLELREVLNFAQFVLLNVDALGIESQTASTNGVLIPGVNNYNFSNFTAFVSTAGSTTTLTIVSAGMGAITGDVASIIFTQGVHTAQIASLITTQGSHTASIATNTTDIASLITTQGVNTAAIAAIDLQTVLDVGNSATNSMSISNLTFQSGTALSDLDVAGELNITNLNMTGSIFFDQATDLFGIGIIEGPAFQLSIGYIFDGVNGSAITIRKDAHAEGSVIAFDMASEGNFFLGQNPAAGDPSLLLHISIVDNKMFITNGASLSVAGTFDASGITYPTSDGSAGQVVTTDGAGTLSFASRPYTYGGSDLAPTNAGPFRFLPFDVVPQNVDLRYILTKTQSGEEGFSLATQFWTNELDNFTVIADIVATTTAASNSLEGITLTNLYRLLKVTTNIVGATTQSWFGVVGDFN